MLHSEKEYLHLQMCEVQALSLLRLGEPCLGISHGPSLLLGEKVAENIGTDLALLGIVVSLRASDQGLDPFAFINSNSAD
jgi:hypothetical protein